MKMKLVRLLPRSLFGRIALLLTVGLISAQIIGASIHLSERFRLLSSTISGEFAQQIAAIYRTINSQPVAARSDIADSLSTPRVRIALINKTEQIPDLDNKTGSNSFTKTFENRLAKVLGPEVRWQMFMNPEIENLKFNVILKLSDGQWIQVKGEPPADIFGQPWHAVMGLSFMMVVIVLLVVVVARSTVRPLSQFAHAARGVAKDLKHPPLLEDGPSEVQEAARAFNTMQKRIRESIEERERFLAAVSHDLKTPITRLRLRTEMLSDARIRDDIEHDVHELQQLIDDALDFLRGRVVNELAQPIDLVALVESVADDFLHLSEISVTAPESLRFTGRPIALQRVLRNLVDNAIKYGKHAHITLKEEDKQVIIMIDDEGEGVPEDQLDAVFEPFFRLEDSRCRETGGTGLGLAIVAQITKSIGGNVTLRNREHGGLRATLTLPL